MPNRSCRKVTLFGASPTFESETSDRSASDSPSGGCCHSCDSFRLCQGSCTNSSEKQQKLGSLRAAPKETLATEMSRTTRSDPSISENICVSTPPHKRRVAMAPENYGDRELVLLWPYKCLSLSVATIQLGQHHLKPYAVTLGPSGRVTKSDVGRTSTPLPLSRVVLQPCSFDSRCAGRATRSVSI